MVRQLRGQLMTGLVDLGISSDELTPAPLLSVQAAISKVMRDMPAIGKDSTAPGSMGGFAFRGIEQITTALRPVMAAVGVVIIPQAQTIVIDPSPGQKEAWQDVMVKFDWLIVGPDGSSFTASTYGIGRDHTDKGANKAQSQAFKYLLMGLFCISDAASDGDGHDYSQSERNDQPPVVPAPPSAAQVETDALLLRLSTFSNRPDEKETIKLWADAFGKKLNGGALFASDEWRAEVTKMLDEIDAESDLIPVEASAGPVIVDEAGD
jgi:hypothetical protein